jgi:hypothetical protein
MQAGRLLEIKPCGRNAVALALNHHNAQHNMIYAELCSTSLINFSHVVTLY